MNEQSQRYTHTVALITPHEALQTKEFLDIALVSASYDIPTAVFFSAAVLRRLQEHPAVELEQALNMLAEFEVPLFSEHTATVYGQSLAAQSLAALAADSQHTLSF